MIRNLALAALTLITLVGAAAAADERPRLKAQAIVTGSIVRIGDLVEHAGIIAKVPIFRAPDLGESGTVPAEAVVEAVRRYELIGLDTGDVSEVTVTRASRAIPADVVEQSVARALSAQYALGPAKDIVVKFDRELRTIQVDPGATGDPRVAFVNYDPRSGRFNVTLDLPTGAATHGNLRLAGSATATTEVVTPARPIERGEVLKQSDLLIERRPRGELGGNSIGDLERVLGMAARVPLRSGQVLRAADLMKPEIVQHNATVTLIYEMPGIRLTVRGKAAEGGAEGDVIGVLNEQSKRVVQGVVVGPGRVLVRSETPQVAANLPPGQ